MSMLRMGSRAIVLGGLAALILMAFGARVSLAADYQDEKGNVCEGNKPFEETKGCPEWGKHVGVENTALGPNMMPVMEASHNVAVAAGALAEDKEGASNVGIGVNALRFNTRGADNTAVGENALLANTTGLDNVAFGNEALHSNTTGQLNLGLGAGAGASLTTGFANVDIANSGVAAESSTIRLGTEETQKRAFIAGIAPTSLQGCTVQVTSEGQLGCNSKAGAEGKEGKEGPPGREGKEGKQGTTGPQGPAGNAAIATFASFENVASGHCLNYTEVGDPGNAQCPSKTSGFAAGRLLAGPTPANGAMVTNIYADSNANVTGKDSVLVAAIDNTTGATLLSCAVNSTNKNNCSNSGSSGPVSPGDNIEVKITATGSSANSKQWRVRFRY